MALSLNSVTPTGHITIIIYWCVGIFNIRGLTFRHGLFLRPFTRAFMNRRFVELVSECQT
jgi:hypothetical protein